MKTNKSVCQEKLKTIRDVLELIQGKWRIPIIIALTYGEKRFGEIQKDIPDISPKMLSQELKALESYLMIERKIIDHYPVRVEYGLTDLGKSMHNMMDEMLSWGVCFREKNISSVNKRDEIQKGQLSKTVF